MPRLSQARITGDLPVTRFSFFGAISFMAIFIAAALLAAGVFVFSASFRVFLATVGGTQPETAPLRRLAQALSARSAVRDLDREYAHLLEQESSRR